MWCHRSMPSLYKHTLKANGKLRRRPKPESFILISYQILLPLLLKLIKIPASSIWSTPFSSTINLWSKPPCRYAYMLVINETISYKRLSSKGPHHCRTVKKDSRAFQALNPNIIFKSAASQSDRVKDRQRLTAGTAESKIFSHIRSYRSG